MIGPTASVAVAKPCATKVSEPVASAETSAGGVMAGAVLSCTITLKPTGVAALPWLSVALQVTGVVAIANCVPDAGLQVAVPAPSTASLVAGDV